MRTLYFLLFPFFIYTSATFAQGTLQSEIDTISSIKEKVDQYNHQAWEYIDFENDSALVLVDEAIRLSQKHNYRLGEVVALETKGYYFEIIDGDYESAANLYFEGIKICEANNMSYATDLYHSIGAMYHTSDNYDKAKEYYTIAYDRAKKEGNLALLKKIITNLASVRSSLKDYATAENLFLEALDITVNSEFDFAINANLGNLYIRQKEFKNAIPYLEKATKKHPDNESSEENLRFLIDAKTGLKDSTNMKSVLNRALKYSQESEALRYKSLMLLSLSSYYKQFEDYKKALNYRDEYLELFEKIKENQRDNTVLELEARFQNEKKENEISKQKLLIEKKEAEKNQMILGLAALGMASIGLFIFFRKRLKYQKTIAEQGKILHNQKITELKQKNKLLALSSMVEGQEAERLRIAKDLHDSLGGLLSTVKNHFSTIQNELKALEKLNLTEKTGTLIDEACIEVRRISHNMMPHALSLSGIQGAMEDLAEQLEGEGYDTTLEISGELKNFDETKKVMIYRLVQEIISNIRKHAEAKTILIQLLVHQNEIKLIVEDDGRGFEYDKAIAKGGLGLKSINSRVEFLDGQIHWDSQLSKGTTISISIPI